MTGSGFGLAVCGGGPAGIGPFVAAARAGVLDELLDLGVVLIERGTPGAGKIGDYRIVANSLGAAFLEGVEGIERGPLAGLAGCAEAEQLRKYAADHPPMSVVAPFLDRVGAAVAAVLAAHPRCRVVTGASVEEIRYAPAGGLAVRAIAGASTVVVTAARALIAMGGRADADFAALDPRLGGVVGALADKVVHADRFIDRTRTVPRSLLRAIAHTGRVAIVGSSHSAWSVAALLHQGVDVRHDGIDVVMFAASRVRLCYRSADEARRDGYAFDEADVCPLSGRVNRYGGLRGPARELARTTLGLAGDPLGTVLGVAGDPLAKPSGSKPGNTGVRVVSLARPGGVEVAEELERAGAVVLATGHRARLPRLCRADGTELVPAQGDGGTVVDDRGRLVTVGDEVHPALIVYGLGAGLRPSAAIGGEPSFHRRATGVWLFQNHLGSVVVHDLLASLSPGRRAK